MRGMGVSGKAFGLCGNGDFCVMAAACMHKKKRQTARSGWDLFQCASMRGGAVNPGNCEKLKSFGAYASPGAGAAQLVGTLQPSYLFVNMIKNLSFNLPTQLIENGHEIFAEIARKAATLLRVELDATSISEKGRAYGLHEAGNYACDTAVNPVVLWLFLFCVIWAVLGFGRKNGGCVPGLIFVAAALSFVVFCTVLRWEPFDEQIHDRLSGASVSHDSCRDPDGDGREAGRTIPFGDCGNRQSSVFRGDC